MYKKHTKILILLFALLLVIAMLGLVACAPDDVDEDDEDEGGGGIVKPIEMNFNQYMTKINNGLKNAQEHVNGVTDYFVSSEYSIYTSTENYTVTYKAVYKENDRDGLYYVRAFDNANHIERANIYYDGRDLYVTSGQEHYLIEEFSSLLLFDVFVSLVKELDMGEMVYGSFMQEYFKEGSILANVFGIKDCSYTKVDEKRELIKIVNGDLSILMGMFNAYIANFVENIDDTFDSATNHYLGFRLSKVFEYRFNSIGIKEIKFSMEENKINDTSIRVEGRMQDNSKYFIDAKYNYSTATEQIPDTVNTATKYNYEGINLGIGSYDGKVSMPSVRETDFDVTIDYDLNTVDNKENEFTFRIYDQLSDEEKPENRYDDIKELIGVYYENETLYVNTVGLYEYVGEGVDLSAFNLPKVYVENIDLISLMEVLYSDLIRLIMVVVDGEYREETTENELEYSAIISAIESDVENKEISITITEELIKKIRQDETDMSVLISRALGLQDDDFRELFGDEVFQLLEIVITYNFETKFITVDLVYDKESIATFEMKRDVFVGTIMPIDLNNLNYSLLAKTDVVTIEYDVVLNPYGAESTDLSAFLGTLIGDVSGKNVNYKLNLGKTLRVRGKVSEYYVLEANGERQLTTAVDLDFFESTTSNKEEKLLVSICTNPLDTQEFFVELYIDIGSYKNENGLFYRIDRQVVSDSLNELVGGESIFTNSSNFEIFFTLFKTIEGNSQAYVSDGYYTVAIMVSDTKDPVNEFIGIKDTNAVAKMKLSFEKIDLSSIDSAKYEEPYLNTIKDVTVKSIYSQGSKWKEDAIVYLNGESIPVKLSYNEETTAIKTGVKEYHPTASIWGKDISYTLHILETYGTYVINSLDLENNLLVIDPAITSTIPTKIAVRYDNYEQGEEDCIIEGFYNANITKDGFNMKLLDGIFDDDTKYVLRIGKDSIAEKEIEIYVAVINRTVKPISIGNQDNDKIDKYVTVNGVQMPVVASTSIDPYTFAMKKREIEDYNPITEFITKERTRLEFKNKYGEKEVINETTLIPEIVELFYDKQGYNWMYLSDLNLNWAFDESLINYNGGVWYAYAYYGNVDGGNAVPIAIEINVKKKIVSYVQINDEIGGQYTIDYLIEETYTVPTTSNSLNTVKVVFTDGTERIISLSKSGAISTEDYCEQYIYGQLNWEGTNNIRSKITVNGVTALFGSETSPTNETTAYVGGEICDTQKVSLRVMVPSRYLSTDEMKSVHIVSAYDLEGNATKSTVYINKAKFNAVDEDYSPLMINPYDARASLPNTILLYVKTANSQISEYKEYDITWVTTDKDNNELNIIELRDGKYVLANPVTAETDLAVYGKVGNGNGSIWITMHVRNLASDIKEIALYKENGDEVNLKETITIDPYLEYAEKLPVGYNAKLGSGEEVSNYDENGKPQGIDWYVVIGDKEWPIVRNAEFMAVTYNSYYGDDGYYIFSNKAEDYSLKMSITNGDISNDIIIEVSVLGRTLLAIKDSSENVITNYVDIYNRDKVDKETYDNEGYAIAGYKGEDENKGINFYKEESTIILERLQELLNTKEETSGIYGVGYAGVCFSETGTETVYAKKIYWSTSQLERIIDALVSPGDDYVFVLQGVIDKGKRNEQLVKVTFTLYDQKLSQIVLNRAEALVSDGVYCIKNDDDANMKLSTNEMNRVIIGGYSENANYKKYFGINNDEIGYSDSTYKYVVYFEVDENFGFYNTSNKIYISPYDYFEYLFGSIGLEFVNLSTEYTKAGISLGYNGDGTKVTKEYFNRSVLGYENNNVVEDETGKYSYGFLILNKLSEGSATDKTLIIVKSVVAERQTQTVTIVPEMFSEDLVEAYPNGYPLPEHIEVEYRKTTGGYYKIKYGTEGWLPTEESKVLGTERISTIEKKFIDVIKGSGYQFSYVLPDGNQETFYLAINFARKDIKEFNYAGSGNVSMYDIKDGVINIKNAYLFLHKDGEKENTFVYDKSLIPTIIDAYTNTGYYTPGEITTFNINWSFKKTEFDDSIFINGEEVIIAEYTFNSYFSNNEATTQTIKVKVNIDKMIFSGIEEDGLVVVENEDETENPVKNVIVIDPYDEKSGYNGTFVLPTQLRLSFNNGTQYYDFTDVKYRLVYENYEGKEIEEDSYRTAISYDESGHKDLPTYVTDPNNVRLRIYAEGIDGIEIVVNFLERLINTVIIDNAVYDDTGEYVYETDGNGATVYDGAYPVNKTYNSYASYWLDGYETKSSGVIPVYFIDPYNTATYALPNTVVLDFKTNKGSFSTYSIADWELFDGKAYQGLKTISSSGLISSEDIFYTAVSGGKRTTYYAGEKDAYKGKKYLMRGYIAVGEEKQEFDVLVIVLNRNLRTEVMINSQYSVEYDFDDPISAMLSDIPSILGEEMFVDFDKYYNDFDKTWTKNNLSGTYSFTIDDNYLYSQFDGSGVATNKAVTPTIEWNKNIDSDGDGEVDCEFDDLTTLGYSGGIEGNVYYFAGRINTLIKYYEIVVSRQFDELIKAQTWDTFFVDGAVSGNFSSSAQSELVKQAEELRIDVVNKTYYITLGKLSKQNENYLAVDLVDIMQRELNELTLSTGKIYDKNKPEDLRIIIKEIHDDLESDYNEWVLNGSQASKITSKIQIYAQWKEDISVFVNSDVANSGDISEYQKLKAQYYDLVMNTTGKFTGDERNRNEKTFATLKNNVSNYIKENIWNEVYNKVLLKDREKMDGILAENTISGNTALSKSLAYTYLNKYLADYKELGVAGEQAVADITIPIIDFTAILDGEGQQITVISFNKFDFTSIDKEYVIQFNLSYKNIYEEEISDAKEEATGESREEEIEQSLKDFAEKYLAEKVNEIAPKERNEETGEYENISGMEDFSYEWLTESDRYAIYDDLWNTLNDYVLENALFYIIQNVGTVTSVDTAINALGVTQTEWEAVESVYNQISIIESENKAFYIEVKNKIAEINEQIAVGKESEKVSTLATYILENHPEVQKMEAYVKEYTAIAVANIAEGMLSSGYADSTTVYYKLLNYYSDNAGPSGFLIGGGKAFQKTYDDVTIGDKTFNLAETLYVILETVFAEDENWESICINYSENTQPGYYKGIRCFVALNTPGLATISKNYYDYLIGYVVSETSPYEYMYENGNELNIRLKKEYVDDILENAIIPEVDALAIEAVKSKLPISETEAKDEYKKFLVYRAIKSTETDQATVFTNWEKTALIEARETYVNKLIKDVKGNNDLYNAIVNYYNNDNVIEKQSFSALIEEVKEEGRIKEKQYKALMDEYKNTNIEKISGNILSGLYNEYRKNVNNNNTSEILTNTIYVSLYYYGPFVSNQGYLTIENSDDDYFNIYAVEDVANIIAKENGISNLSQISRIKDNYATDILLRAYVYYYDNIATDAQKDVIAEVVNMYLNVGTSRIKNDFEGEILKNIAQTGGVSDFGATIYKDLKERYDMGNDYAEDIKNCYKYIYLCNMLEQIEIYIKKYMEIDDVNLKTIGKESNFDVILNKVGINDEELIKKIYEDNARSYIWSCALTSAAGYNDQYSSAIELLTEDAYKYAYETLYESVDEDGEYVNKDEFDEILTEIVDGKTDDSFYEKIFTVLKDNLVKDKTKVLVEATNRAVLVTLFGETYNDIQILSLGSTVVAEKLYYYLTGEIGGVDEFIDEIRVIKNSIRNDAIEESKLSKINSWWDKAWWDETDDFSGEVSQELRDFIYQIYLQSYYQIDVSGLSNENRRRYAEANAMLNTYLFLVDLEEYVSENIPQDYLSEGNREEYEYYVIDAMINTDVMLQSGHNLSLAKAQTERKIIEKAQERALTFRETSGNPAMVNVEENVNDVYYYVDIITTILTKTVYGEMIEEEDIESEKEEKRARKAIYDKYLSKALEYIEYTSVGSDEIYDRSKTNPLYEYVNTIYQMVTGRTLSGSAGSIVDEDSYFGSLTLQYYLDKVGGNYKDALNEMLKERTVEETFYSEDYLIELTDEQTRHVIYFDRTTWEDFLASGSTAVAPSSVKNSGIYIANSLKTEKQNITGGYVYTNSFGARDIEFILADLTEISLMFDGESVENTLSIDAVAPQLPSTAIATGYVKKGAIIEEISLGRVNITEYSEAFNELIYNATTIENDDAYVVKVKAFSNIEMEVKMTVKYLDRSIKDIFVKSSDYVTEDNGIREDGTYSLWNNLMETNVINIKTNNPNVLNETKGEYIMPETLKVSYGNGDVAEFINVKWDMTGVYYSIAGTQGKYVKIKIKEYEYTDKEGNRRVISYNYSNYTVTMKIYDGLTGENIGQEIYGLTESTMVDWNISIIVEDMTVNNVEYFNGETYVTLGVHNDVVGYIDATTSDYKINPYYAEYPERLRITFKNGEYEELELTQKDWTLSQSNALYQIINKPLQDTEGTAGNFKVYFKYLGYSIAVYFDTMDIRLPTLAEDEFIEGGSIYLAKGQDSASLQIKEYYSLMYYNFGKDGLNNWQKVPLSFDEASISEISINAENKYENVTAVIGAHKAGILDKNIVFDIEVIDLRALAIIGDGAFNNFVEYDYFSVARDNSNNKRGGVGEPDVIGDVFVHDSEDGDVYFTATDDEYLYDFIDNKVEIMVEYGVGSTVDSRLASTINGERERKFKLEIEMRSYLYSNVGKPIFIKDETGKKWTWTDIPQTNIRYVDAIYWPLGVPMNMSDLPQLKDENTGEILDVAWDLRDVNVNKANEDGYTVYCTYLASNNAWTSKSLVIYVEKVDVTEQIVELINGEDGRYFSKVYDAKFFELNFNAEMVEFLRENGNKETLAEEEYRIEYYSLGEPEKGWSATNYPINVGEYYVRIRFEDYNVFIATEEDWLFNVKISPYVVDLSKIKIKGEEGNNSVSLVYSGGGQKLTVDEDKYVDGELVDNGIPAMEIDKWFGENEKQLLVAEYKAKGMDEKEAKALAYGDIYARVSENVKKKISDWYDEANASGNFEDESAIKEYVYDYKMLENLTVEEVEVVIEYRYNGVLVPAPSNVGAYTAIISITDRYGNYEARGQKALSVIIEKDQSLVYNFKESILTYSGKEQNPEISGLHVNGSIPEGVTVTYTYVKGEDRIVVINDSNTIYVDEGSSTITNYRGIKNVGNYSVNVVIEGGNNYIDGSFDEPVIINKASVYVVVEDIKVNYLDEVKDAREFVRVYSTENPEGSDNTLKGTDKLSDFGEIFIDTPVESYYPVDEYYTDIVGFGLDAVTRITYTEMGSEVSYNGETYVMLTLKGGTSEGSLYKYENSNGENPYANIISLFDNYYIYIRKCDYNSDGKKESGKYVITNEDGAIGVTDDAELQEVLDGLNEGDSAIIYLTPMKNVGSGEYIPYAPIVIDKEINVTFVGYYDTETAEIATLLSGITINKGTLTVKIVKIAIASAGGVGVVVNDKAGMIKLYESEIVNANSSNNTVGIRTSINYKNRILTNEVTFESLNIGIELTNGELEIDGSTFNGNNTGIAIYSNSTLIMIINSTFEQQEIAIKSTNSTISVVNNTFAYNRTAIEIPLVTNVDMRISNVFEDTNGENIKETQLN